MRIENRAITGTVAAGAVLLALCLQAVGQGPTQIQIRVLNAKTGERVANRKDLLPSKARGTPLNIRPMRREISMLISLRMRKCSRRPSGGRHAGKQRAALIHMSPSPRCSETESRSPNSCGKAKSETIKGKLVIFAEKTSLWKLFQK